jgi:DNA polymerase I-like protein with 3'-5' exonuclease and polymerase domains
MTEHGFAARAEIPIERARDLVRRHKAAYPTFWGRSDAVANRALLGLPLETVFGWRLHWPPGSGVNMRERTARNFPMQANGAEMLRLAASIAVEAGLMICAPIHDALLLESSLEAIDADADRLGMIMGDASECVLGAGRRVRIDAKIVRWPERYSDPRGEAMFGRIKSILDGIELSKAA